jgi:hypothetical protein
VLLVLGTNTHPTEPKLTNRHNGNLHGLLPVQHRSDRWPAPIRPVDRARQDSGYSSRTTNVPESLSDFSRPWNRNTSKTQLARNKNPTQSLAKQHRTGQELTSNSTTQRYMDQANHPRQIPQMDYTGQTGHASAARDEQRPRLNSPKSNSRSPDSLHRFTQDYGDSRNTSWALHNEVMVHKNSLNQEESKDFRQEHH